LERDGLDTFAPALLEA
jgi:hypothetical protein